MQDMEHITADKDLPGHGQDQIEQAVLEMVLELHPHQLTAPELIREVVADQDQPGEADDIRNAIRNLRCSGLLRPVGESVMPTRAGLRAGILLR